MSLFNSNNPASMTICLFLFLSPNKGHKIPVAAASVTCLSAEQGFWQWILALGMYVSQTTLTKLVEENKLIHKGTCMGKQLDPSPLFTKAFPILLQNLILLVIIE